jgi:dTDP-4-amino-4,6-dideoxygalactose transaminase
LLDLKAQFDVIGDELMAAIAEVCDSQRFILGPHVKSLEEQVASYSQCAHGIGVSSGTDALLVALMALEIGQGDAVITSPYTFFATGGAIARVGARPLYCDIDPVTFNLSPTGVRDFLERECEKRDGCWVHKGSGALIKALIPVHLYGQMANMTGLMEVAQAYSLRVIEDAAQAIGSEDASHRRAGSIGDIGCFSFFPSKNLGGMGDGGMCTSNDPELEQRLRVLRVHGSKPKYYHKFVGGNFRLDELQAAVLEVKLKYLDDWTRRRQENAARYDQLFSEAGLEEVVETPAVVDGHRHIYNQYVLRVEDRDELKAALAEARIGTEIYYPVPLHVQECFRDLGQKPDDCPEAMRAAAETLAIPVYPELSPTQQETVVSRISDFYRAR